MTMKHDILPKDIEWHFIGHLQTNKIKYMAPYVALIHGVDSYKLLAEIDKQARKAGRTIPCLLQIHIAQEETKFGFSMDECRTMLDEGTWRTLTHVQIAGVMGMATNTDDMAQVEQEFKTLSDFFEEVKETHFKDIPYYKEISMGMSDDYPLAIRHGSTLIRIGSRIFGQRIY
jgi:pyridoxal phosphate enzyme (YggS family)